MQRVVRSTLVGLLAVAGLTACGDKVQTSQITLTTTPPAAGVVHSVTVSPASVTINVGGTAQLAASVDADASVTDRTVTWTSSDATVATVSTSGLVTGVKAGTVTIVASSKASPTVQGAAAVTVGGGSNVVPTVTISSLNTTVCTPTCTSVPANLQNFGTGGAPATTGQLDVILNVDSQGQPLKSVSATLKCGTDSLTQTQTVSGAAAPLNADASSAPVTFSFNTTQFNSTTGVAALHNGTCAISASAATAAGTQSATTSQQLTLNNADVAFATVSASKGPASDGAGLSWVGGDVTVNVVPVFYTSGRSAVSGIVTLGGTVPASCVPGPCVNATASTQSLTTFPGSVTFSASKAPGASGGVKGETINPVTITTTFVDNSGNSFAPAAVVTGPTRLDNQAPDIATVPVAFAPNTQNTNGGWVGTNFLFSKALTLDASTTSDFKGVDKVTDSTMYAAAGSASSSFKTFVNVTDLPETALGNTYGLRVKVCDALGNCATTAELTQFGVDLTAPTFTASGLANNSTFGLADAVNTTVNVAAVDPSGAGSVTGSGFGATPVIAQDNRLFPKGTSSQQTACVIGTDPNATGLCTGSTAEPLTFAADATNPGQFTLTYYVVDQAGNQSAPTTVNYYIDQNAPAVTGGLAIPSAIAVGASFSASATDNMDVAGANGIMHYPAVAPAGLVPVTGGVQISSAASLSATGIAFDNTLTRTATATFTLPSSGFYRGLATVAGAPAPSAPDSVGIRALDAVGNLSVADQALLPTANLSAPTAYKVGSGAAFDLAGFTVATSKATVSVTGAGGVATTTTLTASVAAATAQSTTPFSQVCFYYQTPAPGAPKNVENGAGAPGSGTAAGDLVLISCTSASVTIDNAGARTFQYTASFTPAASLKGNTLQIVAIGNNANSDALVTDAVALTVNP